MNKKIGFICLLTDGFLLALFGIMTRYLSQYVGNFTQIFLRMALVCLILIPVLSLRKIRLEFNEKNIPAFLTLILSFPIYIILFTVSVNSIKVANAFFFIFISSTIVSYIIGYFLFSEKFNKKNIIVFVLLMIGLFLFAYPFNFEKNIITGILSGVLSGVFWAVSNATRKLYTDKIDNY